jgi:hypothetical protein
MGQQRGPRKYFYPIFSLSHVVFIRNKTPVFYGFVNSHSGVSPISVISETIEVTWTGS